MGIMVVISTQRHAGGISHEVCSWSRSMKILLQGELEFMVLPDLLQWVDSSRKSCCIDTNVRDGERKFYFSNGKLIYASSMKQGERLAEFLVSSGCLSHEKAVQALEKSRIMNKNFTTYLVEDAGLFSIEELTEKVSRLVEDILTRIISHKSGTFAVTDSIPESILKGPIRLDTTYLIFETLRKFDELSRKMGKKDESVELIKQRLFKEDFQLPPLPDIIARVQSVISNEKSTFQDLARVIMADQVLTARILNIANSAFYGNTAKIDSLPVAIARLGMKEITNIVTAIKFKEIKFPGGYRQQVENVLDEALQTAFLAGRLASSCREDPEKAFVGGLLHDMGKTVILFLASDIDIEDSVLNLLLNDRHAELGALIARKWKFPIHIQNIILHHHTYSSAGELMKIVALVQLADSVVQFRGEKDPDSDLLQYLGISRELVLDGYRKAIDAFNQVRSFKA